MIAIKSWFTVLISLTQTNASSGKKSSHTCLISQFGREQVSPLLAGYLNPFLRHDFLSSSLIAQIFSIFRGAAPSSFVRARGSCNHCRLANATDFDLLCAKPHKKVKTKNGKTIIRKYTQKDFDEACVVSAECPEAQTHRLNSPAEWRSDEGAQGKRTSRVCKLLRCFYIFRRLRVWGSVVDLQKVSKKLRFRLA